MHSTHGIAINSKHTELRATTSHSVNVCTYIKSEKHVSINYCVNKVFLPQFPSIIRVNFVQLKSFDITCIVKCIIQYHHSVEDRLNKQYDGRVAYN